MFNDESSAKAAASSSLSASTRLTSLPDSPWPSRCGTELDAECGEAGGWAAELRILGAPMPRSSSTSALQHEKLMRTANASEEEMLNRIEALRRAVWAVETERDESKAEAEMIRREADHLEQRKAELTGRLASRGIPWDVEARLKHQELGNARLAVAYSVQVQRMQDELEHAEDERNELDGRLATALLSVQEAREQQALAEVDLKQKMECEANARQVTETTQSPDSMETQTTDATEVTKEAPAIDESDVRVEVITAQHMLPSDGRTASYSPSLGVPTPQQPPRGTQFIVREEVPAGYADRQGVAGPMRSRSTSTLPLRPPLVPEAVVPPPPRNQARRMYSSTSPQPRTDSLAPPPVVRSSSASRGFPDTRGSFTVPAPWRNSASMAIRVGNGVNMSRSPTRVSVGATRMSSGHHTGHSRSPTRTTWHPGNCTTSPTLQRREVPDSQDAQMRSSSPCAEEQQAPKVAPGMKPPDNRTSWPFRQPSVGTTVYMQAQDGLASSAPHGAIPIQASPGPQSASGPTGLHVSPSQPEIHAMTMVAHGRAQSPLQRPPRLQAEHSSRSSQSSAKPSVRERPMRQQEPSNARSAKGSIRESPMKQQEPKNSSVALSRPGIHASRSSPTCVSNTEIRGFVPTAVAPQAVAAPRMHSGMMSTPLQAALRAPVKSTVSTPLKRSGASPMRSITASPAYKVGSVSTTTVREAKGPAAMVVPPNAYTAPASTYVSQ